MAGLKPHVGEHRLSPTCNLPIDQQFLVTEGSIPGGANNNPDYAPAREMPVPSGITTATTRTVSSSGPFSGVGITSCSDGRACPEGWPQDISPSILAMYREVIIEMCKHVCLLPHTVGRILCGMVPEKMSVLHKAFMDTPFPEEVFWPDSHPTGLVGQVVDLPTLELGADWPLQNDMVLTMKYLGIVRKDRTECDQSITWKLMEEAGGLGPGGLGETHKDMIASRLQTLQREPYISNQQIIKLVLMFYPQRDMLARMACGILNCQRLPNGQDHFETFAVERATMSFLSSTATLNSVIGPFLPRGIAAHPQVELAVTRHLDTGILDWLPFFALLDLKREGSPAVDPNRLLAEFPRERAGHLLLTRRPQEMKSRVQDVLARVLGPSLLAPDCY